MRRALLLVSAVALGCAADDAPPQTAADVATSISRDLGVSKRASCDVTPLLAEAMPQCARIEGSVEVAGDLDPEAARAAFDGDVCRIWNAGGPGSRGGIGLDFGEAREIAAVVFVAATSPPGGVTHALSVSDDGKLWTPVAVLAGSLKPGQPYVVELDPPMPARHLRVTSHGEGAAVTWREIAPLSCWR